MARANSTLVRLFFSLLSVAISVTAHAAPANDLLANAQALAGASGIILGSTEGSSLEPGELALDSAARGSIWYRWSPPTNGIYYFRLSCTGICPGSSPGLHRHGHLQPRSTAAP